MKRLTWIAAVPMMAAFVGLAGPADDAGPSPVRAFTDATMLVKTNARGAVSVVTIATSRSQSYLVVTNGMSAGSLRDWLKFNDRAVDVKGEVSQVSNKLCLTLSGPVKDVTPSLQGGTLQVNTTKEEKKFMGASYVSSDRRFTYTVETNGLSEAAVNQLIELRGRCVDIDGRISQCVMKIVDVRSVIHNKMAEKKKEAAAAKKMKEDAAAKKKGK